MWHAAGDNPLSGDRVGKAAAAGWFLEMAQLASLEVESLDIMGDDRYVVFLLHVRGSRPDGRTVDRPR